MLHDGGSIEDIIIAMNFMNSAIIIIYVRSMLYVINSCRKFDSIIIGFEIRLWIKTCTDT